MLEKISAVSDGIEQIEEEFSALPVESLIDLPATQHRKRSHEMMRHYSAAPAKWKESKSHENDTADQEMEEIEEMVDVSGTTKVTAHGPKKMNWSNKSVIDWNHRLSTI